MKQQALTDFLIFLIILIFLNIIMLSCQCTQKFVLVHYFKSRVCDIKKKITKDSRKIPVLA